MSVGNRGFAEDEVHTDEVSNFCLNNVRRKGETAL